MNYEVKSLLLPFHFGAIDDKSRLTVERELLSDEEMLVDYFDLKRKMESAAQVPQGPSAALWFKLQNHIRPRRKFYFSLAIGAAVAASLVILTVMFFHTSNVGTQNSTELLFDSNRELPANSNVL